MNRGSLGHDDVAGVLDDGHAVRVQKLAVFFATFSKLELETTLFVENLKKALSNFASHQRYTVVINFFIQKHALYNVTFTDKIPSFFTKCFLSEM